MKTNMKSPVKIFLSWRELSGDMMLRFLHKTWYCIHHKVVLQASSIKHQHHSVVSIEIPLSITEYHEESEEIHEWITNCLDEEPKPKNI